MWSFFSIYRSNKKSRRFLHTNENDITQCVRRWKSAAVCSWKSIWGNSQTISLSWPSTELFSAPTDFISCYCCCYCKLLMIHGDSTNSSSFLEQIFSSRDLLTHQRRLLCGNLFFMVIIWRELLLIRVVFNSQYYLWRI